MGVPMASGLRMLVPQSHQLFIWVFLWLVAKGGVLEPTNYSCGYSCGAIPIGIHMAIGIRGFFY